MDQQPSATTPHAAGPAGAARAYRLPTRYSPSALRVYAGCAQRYEYQYLQRLPTDPVPTRELLLGIAVHAALADVFRLPVARRSEHALHEALRRRWRPLRHPLTFTSREEEARWGRRGLEMLSGCCSHYGLDTQPLAVEAWVRADLGNGLSLSGKVDRVDPVAGSSAIEVIDFKTGEPKAELDVSADVGAQIYALAAARTFRRPVRRVRFLYLAEPGVEATWKPTPGELALARVQLESRIDEIRGDTEFQPDPGFGCVYCSYGDICPGFDIPADVLAEIQRRGDT